MKLNFVVFFLLSSVLLSSAQNPIVPPGTFMADPEAHVWEDGKLYVYGSRDESDDYWCSYAYDVLVTEDLAHWSVVENTFASKGIYDQVRDHDKLLFAPDCSYKNGTYYLYYCSPGKPYTEGVATSRSPYGPFTRGVPIAGAYAIDPAVLVDDDGQAYYYWGQQYIRAAKLKPNMMEIDTVTLTRPLDQAGTKAFHEGASIRKIGEWYYLVFADESRRGRPTCLGYAMSKDPMGPFEYKGIIIDNYGADPNIWNNHGSIAKFGDQWYVFYHRSTRNSKKFRKACIEPITINKDGTIDEVEMTTQGAGKPLPATGVLDAARACQLSGDLFIGSLPSANLPTEGLTNISSGDYATYKYLSFDKKLSKFRVKTLNAKPGTIELRLDQPDGQLIGTCSINRQQDKTAFSISECPIDKVSGTHALYLVFRGEQDQLMEVDWFQFRE